MGTDTQAAATRIIRPSTLSGSGVSERLRRSWPDVLLAGLLSMATLVVHDVGYMFSAPFWRDEAWVAISTKLPLNQLPEVSASTPIGWAFLLRLVFVGGDERLRLIPLMFAVLTVTAAYVYARSLPWARLWLARLAAALAGCVALLVPSALVRDDLKQYTADAFVTLVVLWLVSRLETSWTRRRLITLGIVVVVGFLFSTAALFVGVAAFGSVAFVALARRTWRRLAESVAVGGATGTLLVLVFVVAYKPGLPVGLNDYWKAHYVPVDQGWLAVANFTVRGGQEMASYLGLGPLPVALLLVAGGIATLVWLRRTSVAIVVPALLAEMVLLSALQQYPLFNLRTSHFLLMACAVTGSIGVAGLCARVARVRVAASVAVAGVAVALFVTNPQVVSAVRSTPIPAQGLRAPTRYIAAQLRPNDIVVVAMASSCGFAYYWDTGAPVAQPVSSNLHGFINVFPDQPNILVATDRTPAEVAAVMDKAVAAAAEIGSGARIWVVHDHVQPAEAKAFVDTAKAHRLTIETVIQGRLLLLTSGTT